MRNFITEKAQFQRAMRDLGESEGKRIYDEAYNRCRKDKMSEAGSKEFAESVVVGHANWVMR